MRPVRAIVTTAVRITTRSTIGSSQVPILVTWLSFLARIPVQAVHSGDEPERHERSQPCPADHYFIDKQRHEEQSGQRDRSVRPGYYPVLLPIVGPLTTASGSDQRFECLL